jgi:hypothetical protein
MSLEGEEATLRQACAMLKERLPSDPEIGLTMGSDLDRLVDFS